MEARFLSLAILLASLTSMGANYRTEHFVVTAATPQLAREIGDKAEEFRRDLAIEWLGKELPPWSQPCPITVQVAPQLGAGGATSFMFDRGRPYGWTMSIQGSHERVLDSVLPHEITHTIFATHFGRPLPRWADEGACTTVEHQSEKHRQWDNLVQFLTTGRGIAFNKMFAMKEYPADILPLYAQGFSLARYMIALRGKREFVNYVGEGMQTNNWTAVTQKYYGVESLSALQITWLDWVRQGSPPIRSISDPAAGPSFDRSLIAKGQGSRIESSVASSSAVRQVSGTTSESLEMAPVPSQQRAVDSQVAPSSRAVSSGSWYARQQDASVVQPPREEALSSGPAVFREPRKDSSPTHEPAGVTIQQTTRPQSLQTPRQIVVEWSRPVGVSPPVTKSAAPSGTSYYDVSASSTIRR